MKLTVLWMTNLMIIAASFIIVFTEYHGQSGDDKIA